MTPLRIANVQLATNLLLAPIAGYCDLAFRLVARSCGGVGMACTDLISAEGLLRNSATSHRLAITAPGDAPLCMQLYGSDGDRLAEAARWAEGQGADVVDINMGCPVDKVTKKDGGSKLLCDPDNTLRLVDKVKGALRNVPLTCKLRLGWDDGSIVAPYLARRLEEAGVSLVTIHGRTTEMKFTGQARLDGIAEVVAAVKRIPVVGNGDVKTPADAKRMLDYTKCAGLMIGRGALGAPWLFRDIWTFLSTGTVPEPLSIEEKVRLIREHFYGMVKYRSERTAINEIRKRVSWYGKHMNPCWLLKDRMQTIASAAEFDAACGEFLAWRADYDAGRVSNERPVAEEAADAA